MYYIVTGNNPHCGTLMSECTYISNPAVILKMTQTAFTNPYLLLMIHACHQLFKRLVHYSHLVNYMCI